jgi:hypothetical protein
MLARVLLFGALAFGWPALAAPRPAGVEALAGEYSRDYKGQIVDGQTYDAVDLLQIVPTGPGKAFVGLDLNFFNGHACAFWGIASLEGDALVYRARPEPGFDPCVLTVKRQGRTVRVLDEPGACDRGRCSARGTIGGASFPVPSRTPITDLKELQASDGYKEAFAEAARN